MFDWFMTLPGILVISGVVLLVVAVILYLKGNKTEKKEIQEEVSTPSTENTTLTAEEEIQNMYVFDNNVENTQPVEEVHEEIAQEQVVENNNTSYAFDNNGVVTEDTTANNEVEIKIEEPAPVVEENNTSYAFDNNGVVTEDTTASNEVEIKIEEPAPIYGGNDPLENTQVLPEVEKTPYGMETPVVDTIVGEEKKEIEEL